MKNRHGLLAVLAMALVILALTASSAFAGPGNPHFVSGRVSLSGASLVCTFKEAGLPSGARETVTLRAVQTITYESVNGGNKNPSAANKKTTQSPSSVSGSFTTDRNGNINGTLTLAPLSASAVGFSSPPGQTTTLVSVIYSNIRLVDSTSGATLSIPGTFTYTNPLAPPVR
jgi:hypothetical protein